MYFMYYYRNTMSKPRILLSKEQMILLHFITQHEDVRYTQVLKYDLGFLGITPNIAKQLVLYYEIYLHSVDETQKTVHKSLFPSWATEPVTKQDTSKHRYVGIMPYGYWEEK